MKSQFTTQAFFKFVVLIIIFTLFTVWTVANHNIMVHQDSLVLSNHLVGEAATTIDNKGNKYSANEMMNDNNVDRVSVNNNLGVLDMEEMTCNLVDSVNKSFVFISNSYQSVSNTSADDRTSINSRVNLTKSLGLNSLMCDPATSGIPDSDSDGVDDFCDEDADNDGILDINEGYTPPITQTTYVPVSYSQGLASSGAGTVSGRLASIEGCITDFTVDFAFISTGGDIPDLDPSSDGGRLSIEYRGGLSGTSQVTYTFSQSVDVLLALSSNHTDESVTFITPYNSIDPGLGSTIESTNPVVWNNGNESDRTRFEFLNVTQIILGLEGDDLNQSQQMSVKDYQIDACIDTDMDGIADFRDTDSDNDGCFDVLESMGIDTNNDGRLDGTGFDSNGLVTGGTGGYNGLTGGEYTAVQINPTMAPSDQTVNAGASTSFTVAARAIPDSASGSLMYQWYDGDPNSGGTVLSDSGVYSGTNTPTLNISDATGLNGTIYAVLVSHIGNTCADKIRTAQLTVNDPCDPITSGNIDSDSDGIADICDEDDDNDGILDVNELNVSSFTQLSIADLGLSPGTINSNTNIDISSVLGLPTGSVFATYNNVVTDGSQLNYASATVPADFVFTSTVPLVMNIRIGAGGFGPNEVVGFTVEDNTLFNFTGVLSTGQATSFDPVTDSYTIDSGPLSVSGGNLQWNSSSAFTSFNISFSDTYDGSRYFLRFSLPDDTDNDGIFDFQDLDSDGDGCNDVVESGGTDTNNDGRLDGTGFETDGLVTGGTGGYDGLAGEEYRAVQVNLTTAPSDQTVNEGDPASFSVTASADEATAYSTGSPVYGTVGNANGGLMYQWYNGDPNTGGTVLSDGGVYSGTNTPTLNISDATGLNGTTYAVRVSHVGNTCAAEVRTVQLTANDPCDPIASGNTDTDNDGIADVCDEDDDNDGDPDVTDPNPTEPCIFSNNQVLANASLPYWNLDCDGDGDPKASDPDDYEPCIYSDSQIPNNADAAWNNLDCDGDGVVNGTEINPPNGGIPTNPNNPCSFIANDRSVPVTVNVVCNIPPSSCPIAPCHNISSQIYLGNNPPASAGETSSSEDDDDGVGIPNNIRPNTTIRFPTTIYNITGNNVHLYVWIDWNGDADYDDAGEQVFTATYNYGTYNGQFTVPVGVQIPANAVIGSDIGILFRVSSDPTFINTPCGASPCAPDGESEDYLFQVECAPQICLPAVMTIIRG